MKRVGASQDKTAWYGDDPEGHACMMDASSGGPHFGQKILS